MGEASVISLCKSKGYPAVLDDRLAARVSIKLKVKHTGTLNIIREAYCRDIIKEKIDLKTIIKDLKQKDSFYLTQELVNWILSAEKNR